MGWFSSKNNDDDKDEKEKEPAWVDTRPETGSNSYFGTDEDPRKHGNGGTGQGANREAGWW